MAKHITNKKAKQLKSDKVKAISVADIMKRKDKVLRIKNIPKTFASIGDNDSTILVVGSMESIQYEEVVHPPHYNQLPNGIECWDVTEHFPTNIGSAMKYCESGANAKSDTGNAQAGNDGGWSGAAGDGPTTGTPARSGGGQSTSSSKATSQSNGDVGTSTATGGVGAVQEVTQPSPPPTQETWERDTTKPEQMTPEERRDAKIQVIAVETEKGLKPIYYLAIREGDSIGIYGSNYSEIEGELIGMAKPINLIARPTLTEVRQAGSSAPAYIEKLAIDEGAPIYRANGIGVQSAHQAEIALARIQKKPVSKAAVDAYGITLPEGYVQDGELYVYRPSGTVEAKPEPTPKEPEYISPKEIAERFAAESERNARRQSDTVAEMEAKEAAYKPQVRQSGAELLEEYKAQQKAKPAPQPKPAAEVGTPISDPLGYGTALIALFPSLQKAGVTVIPIEEAMTRLDAEWQKKKDSGKATRLVWRAGLKPGQDSVKDLKKVIQYTQRQIDLLEGKTKSMK